MKFIEQFAETKFSESEPRLNRRKTGSIGFPEKYTGKPRLIVNLLPSHPFQYVMHRSILEFLLPGVITRIVKDLHLENLTFLVNSQLRKEYKPILESLSCKVLYSSPCYPFQNKNHGLPGKDLNVISWFEFISIAAASLGEVLTDFPLSATYFSRSEKVKKQLTGPLSLQELCGIFGIRSEDHLFTNHPFCGTILDPLAISSQNSPPEILIFPRDSRETPTILSRIAGRFIPAGYFFGGVYDTTDSCKNLPCSKCLKCVTICPVRLHPFILSALADKGTLKDAAEFGAGECVECGLCSFTCPSGIPLMHNISKLKKELQ